MGIRALRASTAFVAICIASPIWAATPAEVWQSWQDMSTSAGQTLTTESVEEGDDGIVVSGLTSTYEKDGVKSEATVDELEFTDNGDGTVTVTMSETVPLTVTVPATEAGGSPTTVTVSIGQPGMELTASGEADAISYDYSAPEMSIALDQIEGVDAEAIDLVAEGKLTDIAGSYTVEKDGDATAVSYDLTASSMNLTLTGKDVDPSPGADGATGPSDVNVVASFADLKLTGEGAPMNPAVMENLAKALADGVQSSGSFSAGATTMVADVTEAGKATHIDMTGASSDFTFGLGPDGLVYGGSGKDVVMTLSGGEIPFPELKLTYGEAAFNLEMPLLKGDAPQDFALLTKLVDFTISDDVWNMVDPTQQLPRDPATLVIDTKGTATMTADLVDPAQMENMAAPPAMLNSLDLTELHAKVAGAELTGNGAFTFDNSDMTTFPGFPAPTGKVDLKLTGGNGLMDKLVAMGMLQEQDVMGFRMMLAMFANTSADKDEMTSTIEFKDKGFFANGQRLQ